MSKKTENQNQQVQDFNGVAMGCGSTGVQRLKEFFEDDEETKFTQTEKQQKQQYRSPNKDRRRRLF